MISKYVLFCEGNEQSPDARLLSALYTRKGVTVKPLGGKRTLSGYVEGYIEGNAKASHVAVRDRDFDVVPDEQNPPGSLIKTHIPTLFLWVRHEIENYLLEPAILAHVLDDVRTWKNAPPIDVQDATGARAVLDAAAKRIMFFEASRWALGTLTRKVKDVSVLHNRWGLDFPTLPDADELAESKCRVNTCLGVQKFHQNTRQISEHDAATRYEHYVNAFSDPAFWSDARYLVWFSGKDIFASILREVGLPPGYYDGVVNRALHHFINDSAVERPKEFEQLGEEIDRMIKR